MATLKEWLASKRPVKLGGMAPGTSLSDDARILKAALGLPIQLVEGYKGGAAVKLAVNQGELEGACGLAWETQNVTWKEELKVDEYCAPGQPQAASRASQRPAGD